MNDFELPLTCIYMRWGLNWKVGRGKARAYVLRLAQWKFSHRSTIRACRAAGHIQLPNYMPVCV